MADISIYNLPLELTEIPAANDLLMLVDMDEGTLDKTKKIKYSNLTAGLQTASTILSALSSDLPTINGLILWDGTLESATQVVAGNGVAIGGGTISAAIAAGNGISIVDGATKTIALSKFGIESLATPASNSIILISSAGGSSFLSLGSGLSFGGGQISLSHLGIESLTDPNSDKIMFWDDSAGSLQWLTIGSDAGLAISGTSLVHNPEPTVVSLRAVEGSTLLTNEIATYWTVPHELDGATLSTVDIAFVNTSGSATVQLARASVASPTSFSNILTAATVTSGWSSIASGQTQGTGTVTLSAGDRIRVTVSSASTATGLDVLMGMTA